MKLNINNNDIGIKYNAILSEKSITPSEITENVEWLKNALLPIKLSEDIKFCNIKCTFLFGADTSDNFEKIFSQFCKDTKECDLKFDDIELNYHCYIKSIGDYEQIGCFHYLVQLEWIGYKYGNFVTEILNSVPSKDIVIDGNEPTPAIVTVTVPNDTIMLTITGFREPITINNLKANIPIVIDSEDSTVLQGTTNKYGDTDMWEFPVLEAGTNTIVSSTSVCTIQIKYKPRWT